MCVSPSASGRPASCCSRCSIFLKFLGHFACTDSSEIEAADDVPSLPAVQRGLLPAVEGNKQVCLLPLRVLQDSGHR